jgi:tetratricopeptide (TPR) repeat protein
MARSFGSSPVVPAGSFDHAASDEHFSLERRGGKPWLKRSQNGFDGVMQKSIDYGIGSGDRARSYLHRTAAGELLELPLTWYAENGGHWGMSPAYDRPDHPGFSRRVTFRCMFCHNAYPAVAPGSDDSDAATRFSAGALPEGIDCQRCHGPGREHMDAVRRGLAADVVRRAILNPAKLAPERQMEVCLQCHLETTTLRLPAAIKRYGRGVFSYRPGEPLADYILHFDYAPGGAFDDRFQFTSAPYRLRKSACFQQSRGALTCTTCHNPHDASKAGSDACSRCHGAAVAELARSRRHPAARDCVGCHMAKRRPSDAIHVTVTDHYIRKRPLGDPPGPVVERNGANTPEYRGEVVLYYPPGLKDELYIAVAQIQQQSNLPEGLKLLEAAVAKYAPERGDFYLELAEGYRHADGLDKAAALFQAAGSRSPQDWRPWYGLGLTVAAAGNLDRSVETLRHALDVSPQESVLRALASVLSRQGDIAGAMAALRRALAADPDSAEARNDLGMAFLRLADGANAEAEFREAVRLRPEVAAIRANLAQVLARNGKRSEARRHFEAALRIDPVPGTTHSNFGSLLLELGQPQSAIREFRAAIAAQTGSAVFHYNLGAALAAGGQPAEAEESFHKAIERAPDYFEAHLRLGQLLMGRRQTEPAADHLRKAVESPDPVVRDAALKLLGR